MVLSSFFQIEIGGQNVFLPVFLVHHTNMFGRFAGPECLQLGRAAGLRLAHGERIQQSEQACRNSASAL